MKVRFLDTNVLLHSPTALNSFKDTLLVIPLIVIEELDQQKKRQDEVGKNARKMIKLLDSLQNKAERNGEMTVKDTVKLIIYSQCDYESIARFGLDSNKPDNHILAQALTFEATYKTEVIFVSNDGAARVKARKLGLSVETLEEDRVATPLDEFYTGWAEIQINTKQINSFYTEGLINTDQDLLINQFVLMRNIENPKQTALGKYNGEVITSLINSDAKPWDIEAKNMQQHFLLEALLDPEIQLVTVLGRAGVGKTIVSIAAALEQVDKNIYRKALVYKPIIPVGRDIGFLPGEQCDKLKPWMASVYDALEFIIDNKKKEIAKPNRQKGRTRKQKDEDDNFDCKFSLDPIEDLIAQGNIELGAMTYIRGRSIPRIFMILEEAQNTSPHEVKTIISRAGEGTKIVLVGDCEQIDSPFLDSQNNGLAYTIDRFKGQRIHSHITLEKPERSTLSALAAELL